MGKSSIPEIVGPALDAAASCYEERASRRVGPTRQKAELRDNGKPGPEDAVGNQNMLPPKYATLAWGLFWVGGKWESAAAERRGLGAFLLWLIAGTSERWGLPSTPSPGDVLWRRWRVGAEMDLYNLPLALSPYVYLVSHSLLPLAELKPFPLSCHFSRNLLFFVKMLL